ncbi:MAG: hypothetical protein K9J06_02400 [Flavobacteriales bacterium]|nr:hypothetical protein [Flavobacteriales bacterium]
MRPAVHIFLMFLLSGQASAQVFDWAMEAGGLGLDAGRAVCTDPDGNVIMVGSYSGVAQFGDTTLVGLGGPDAFIGKYTSEGDLLWMQTVRGPSEDLARGVTTDHEGNILVTGHFTHSAYFILTEADTVELLSAGKKDVFIAKYAPDGQLIWAERAGGPEDDTGTDIKWHRYEGKLAISGGFQGRATFANVSMLAIGLTDAFLLCMDGNGTSLWVRNGGGPQHDVAASVAFDPYGAGIYITGDYYASANFSGTTIYATGSSDVFLARFDLQGNLQWVRSQGGANLDVATKVDCDLQGNVLVAGHYQMTTVFGPFSATARGYNDVFLAKFNGADGSPVWLRSMGGTDLETCQGLLVDWDGTAYVTGMFDTRLISAQDTLFGNGYDIFIACLEPSGHTRYLKGAGAGSADIPMAICFGPDQSLFVTGFFYFFAAFDGITIGNALNGDIFLARLTDIVGVEEAHIAPTLSCGRYDPVQQSVRLSCELRGPWQVIDLLGRTLLQGNATQAEVPLHGLPSGYFLFTVDDGQQRAVVPFVVR